LPPLLELPYGRIHVVLAGPLSAVNQIVEDWLTAASIQETRTSTRYEEISAQLDHSKFQQRATPSLIWPADDSWFVVTDVDFDSTLVGGSAALIDAIVKSPNLEAWHVRPTDSLADNADKVNVVHEN
jgi:hypothetical protein